MSAPQFCALRGLRSSLGYRPGRASVEISTTHVVYPTDVPEILNDFEVCQPPANHGAIRRFSSLKSSPFQVPGCLAAVPWVLGRLRFHNPGSSLRDQVQPTVE